ncbi:MAG: non-canonical purine NTP pyrophosphatase, partial [Pseudonocardia sp.]|nr:non-canonical purine NTP pyrophosphatase [Pseudonocardia sp.]
GPAADGANVALLLTQLGDVPDERRGASFVCAAALVTPAGVEHIVEGVMTGSVVREPRGSGGFGYDPVFAATGHDRTTAELPPAEKDELSHRGRAFRALAPIVASVLDGAQEIRGVRS